MKRYCVERIIVENNGKGPHALLYLEDIKTACRIERKYEIGEIKSLQEGDIVEIGENTLRIDKVQTMARKEGLQRRLEDLFKRSKKAK